MQHIVGNDYALANYVLSADCIINPALVLLICETFHAELNLMNLSNIKRKEKLIMKKNFVKLVVNINHVARVVGITDEIGAHTLRKAFAYHRYKQYKDIVYIQKLLNHSSPVITLAYIGVTRDTLDDMYRDCEL